jgi:hypothetical protein
MSTKLLPKHVTPAMQELYKLLLKSEKFLNWNKPTEKLRPMDPAVSAGKVLTCDVADQHFTPQQLADAWGVSTETIRQIFRDEQGVLKIGKPGTRVKRPYFTLRIPREIAERVHRRLSA